MHNYYSEIWIIQTPLFWISGSFLSALTFPIIIFKNIFILNIILDNLKNIYISWHNLQILLLDFWIKNLGYSVLNTVHWELFTYHLRIWIYIKVVVWIYLLLYFACLLRVKKQFCCWKGYKMNSHCFRHLNMLSHQVRVQFKIQFHFCFILLFLFYTLAYLIV